MPEMSFIAKVTSVWLVPFVTWGGETNAVSSRGAVSAAILNMRIDAPPATSAVNAVAGCNACPLGQVVKLAAGTFTIA
jgi:hypothetical protein